MRTRSHSRFEKEVTCSFNITSMTKGKSIHIINEREIREGIR